MEIGSAKLVQTPQNKLILYAKLYQKFGELDKAKYEVKDKNNQNKDYIEINNIKFDKNDYERVLEKFKNKDREIKLHEALHSSILGKSVSYKYQMGLDGKLYAVGGETKLDTTLPSNPKEALYKIEQIKKAATASPDLSRADLNIANSADIVKAKLLIMSNNHLETK